MTILGLILALLFGSGVTAVVVWALYRAKSSRDTTMIVTERMEYWLSEAAKEKERADYFKMQFEILIGKPIQFQSTITQDGIRELAALIAANLDKAKFRVN